MIIWRWSRTTWLTLFYLGGLFAGLALGLQIGFLTGRAAGQSMGAAPCRR